MPTVTTHTQEALSLKDKSQHIAQYICQFMPSKIVDFDGQNKFKEKIENLIAQEKSLHFLLPEFSFKSTNHERKCISAHVDFGEYLALLTISIMIENIQKIYPFVQCTILSDGLVYHAEGDAPYNDIVIYHEEMATLSKHFSARCLR